MKALKNEVDNVGMGRENHDPSFEITLSVDNNSNTIEV